MAASAYIQDYCHIRDSKIAVNGETIFKGDTEDFPSFIKAAYKALDTDYGKFFKMDHLSKLAFIASDLLLHNEKEKNMALVLSNRAGSLDTDRKHHSSMADYPSPAVFVYTLPNICLGEISIKHRLYSENAFFVFDRFNADALFDYANVLLDSQKAEKVLCGWVDMDEGKYDGFLYVVSKNGIFTHSTEEINRLYQTP
ncbi:3-oxoacyl-ACP synthase [Aggregatimonas sangjinii]|uniref:3-oxoacyl-ACP synthase n=1 Tax=Aggregatimonas sangjinii TaxID=2583587 RepID=A0A5B7SWU3_9FLAO|nr:3-oxoacyl-ACP synthase [Aggregatimonas sangjinii]QCX01478.1 3-oxoacyl-ACP synthase [Aggregatimonas sangjinii]